MRVVVSKDLLDNGDYYTIYSPDKKEPEKRRLNNGYLTVERLKTYCIIVVE